MADMTMVTKPKDMCKKNVVAHKEPLLPLPVNAMMLLYAPTNPRHCWQWQLVELVRTRSTYKGFKQDILGIWRSGEWHLSGQTCNGKIESPVAALEQHCSKLALNHNTK